MRHIPLMFLAMAFAIAGCASGTGVFPASDDYVAPGTAPSTSSAVPKGCTQQIFYYDDDKDGYGRSDISLSACADTPPVRYVAKGGDCNDSDATIHPGATEVCDGVDNDCHGGVDDTTTSWFLDHDKDLHGDPNPVFALVGPCTGIPGKKQFVANSDDCDDSDPKNFPGNKEVCDGQDNNCNMQTDEGEGVKGDFFFDADLDGHGDVNKPTKACNASVGVVVSSDDCNDDPLKDGAKMFPGNPEVCDSLDNDCNKLVDDGDVMKTYFKDDDGDGYGAASKPVQSCSLPVGATTSSNDCNDDLLTGKDVHPGVTETCNEVDDNCNSVTDEGVKLSFYFDADGDGHAGAGNPFFACIAPKGYYLDKTDCNDADPDIYPGAKEICDGKENGCDGVKLVEPDSLCPAKPYKKATCGGVDGCQYEDEKLLMNCSNPDLYKQSDGYTCGVAYYFGDALGDKKIVMNFEKVASSPLMADVCAELKKGKTLHVSAFVQIDFDPQLVWIDTLFLKLVDSFTNLEIQKKNPGNVVVGYSVEYDLTLPDIPACQ